MSQSIRPQKGDFAEYYDLYVSKVPDGPIYGYSSVVSGSLYYLIGGLRGSEQKRIYKKAGC